MKTTFRGLITILVFAIVWEASSVTLSLLSTPSDLAVITALILGFLIVPFTGYSLYFIWRTPCKKLVDWSSGY